MIPSFYMSTPLISTPEAAIQNLWACPASRRSGSIPRKLAGVTESRPSGNDPLPMTETGYRSHFGSSADVDAEGGPVEFVRAWLKCDDQLPEWKARAGRTPPALAVLNFSVRRSLSPAHHRSDVQPRTRRRRGLSSSGFAQITNAGHLAGTGDLNENVSAISGKSSHLEGLAPNNRDF